MSVIELELPTSWAVFFEFFFHADFPTGFHADFHGGFHAGNNTRIKRCIDFRPIQECELRYPDATSAAVLFFRQQEIQDM